MSREDVRRALESIGPRPTGHDIARALDNTEPPRNPGWANYHDSAKTTGSRLTLPAGVRTQVTIDGLGSRSDKTYAEGFGDFDPWASNKLMGESLGEAYLVRLGLTIETTGDTFSGITGLITALLTSVLKANVEDENTLIIEFDFGAFSVKDTLTAPRTAFTTADVTRLFLLHSGPAVLDPGGTLYMTSSQTAQIWDVDLLIQRLYTPA